MSLTPFKIDESPHNMDGLRLYAHDGLKEVEAFISRKVMDGWADPLERSERGRSLFRSQYTALGRLNLPAIDRIASGKYRRGTAFNRQHPFIEVLTSDITESAESLDVSKLVREPLPPAFHRLA
jgi:hypothetical protein